MPKTLLVRFTRALRPTKIWRRSQRALGPKPIFLENYERVLRGPKEILGMSENALLDLKISGRSERVLGAIDIGEFKRAFGGGTGRS